MLAYKIRLPLYSNKLLFMFAEDMTSEQRRENYLCDITYVTNSELGFDYLRDNLATESNSCVMWKCCIFSYVLSIYGVIFPSYEYMSFGSTEC